jgi:MerR family mercuric resistance operon transcriptional regulator
MGSVATPGSREKIAPSAAGAEGPLIPIGALAARTRCNIETIRFYEKIGVLPKPARTEGGHRAYGRAHVERLTFVRRARELGFTLDEVRALLRLAEASEVPCAEVKDLAATHLAEVKTKIADLRAMQKALTILVAQCDTRGDAADQPGCPLIETLLTSATNGR